MDEQENAALNMIRAIYEDGEAEINDRVYTFHKMTHKQRRKVFSFYTKIAADVTRGDFGFLDAPEFAPVESVINNAVSIDGSLLSKIGDAHWEQHPDDYITFISTALSVISYPFFTAGVTS